MKVPRVRHEAARELRIITESRHATSVVALPRRLRFAFNTFAQQHYRPFPWRESGVGPFGLLIAEVMLRQTKAEDIVSPWTFLMATYPDPLRLSRARQQTLRTILHPLGLHNQRANSLRELAAAIVQGHEGIVPRSLEELLKLPHVGMYGACALSCFAFGARLPVVDANVLRVFRRVSGAALGSDLRRSPEAWSLAWSILPRDATMHNYGLLDFAASICSPKFPKCDTCPLKGVCAYEASRRKTFKG